MKKRSSPPDATASSPAPAESVREAVAEIEAMGAQGHGLARIDGVKTHIPFTLPGERVRVSILGEKAEAVAIEIASPERRAPICRHFCACGGCSLQHWDDAAYARWKTGLVTSALARQGLEAPVEAFRTYPLGRRRRAVFTVRKENGQVRLGFNAARKHDIVGLAECPILTPQMASALPLLREALQAALPNAGEARIYITAAENGLDCAIEGAELAAGRRGALIAELEAASIIRLAWNGDIVFLKAAPFVMAGGAKVALPAGAFLQAVEACERDMAQFAVSALNDAKAERGPACDLFAGLGAFTFPCAKSAPIAAYEMNADAVAALGAAAKAAAAIKPVKAIRRDLFRNPLGPLELNAFSAAVLDPPREGAEAQARAIAASKIGAAIMLSCNPATFARDAAIMAAGGFGLARLAAFDQFQFSAHVEIAALLLRPVNKKGRLAPALKR